MFVVLAILTTLLGEHSNLSSFLDLLEYLSSLRHKGELKANFKKYCKTNKMKSVTDLVIVQHFTVIRLNDYTGDGLSFLILISHLASIHAEQIKI